MKKIRIIALGLTILALISNYSIYAQKEEKNLSNEKKIKNYEDIVTSYCETKEGIFKVHSIDNQVYYEIKETLLGKEFLWLTQFAKTQTGFGFGGTEVIRRVVKWERLQDKILLRNIEYALRADKNTPEEISVKASSIDQIICAFNIETFSKEGNVLINVSDLFLNDIHEFSPMKALGAIDKDKNRTFITSIKVFNQNIETKVLSTYKLKPELDEKKNKEDLEDKKINDPSLGYVTVELSHSMIELPDKLMKPRFFDKRIGYFAGSHQNYSNNDHEVEEITYIRRWRLEKEDPSAEISEPVKPIVYYVGREVPEKWHKYIIEGIEMWQPVFEAAGFKNAIIGKIAPSIVENPDFDPEDVRYSTIRWLSSTIANAYGPHVQDPRTGEILEADIRIFHNVLSLIRDWYFIQASPSDVRARNLPLSDEIIGEALRYVVAHEVGHTLGLRHNFKSTHFYDVEKYRDKEFTQRYGLEASIMDYGRFNYIAQPGDSAAMIPVIGPYDYFAIEWGYKEFSGTLIPEEDIPYLNKIASRQQTEPMLRFGGGYENGIEGIGDPFARSEDLGDDPIKATTYGLKNIELISTYIIEACSETDEDYKMLKHMYDELLAQMFRELGQIGALVGGIELESWVYGQSSDLYIPLNKNKQKEAINFLNKYGFITPDYLIKKDLVSRIGMYGINEKISKHQKELLYSILNENTANRLIDLEATNYNSYTIFEMFNDLKSGIFSELNSKNPEINVYRRNLQKAFVEQLLGFIKNDKVKNDLRSVSTGVLFELKSDIKKYSVKIEIVLNIIIFLI